MSGQDYYELLGIDPSANQEDIEAGYRRAAQYWHPDRNKTLNASQMMRVINEARDVLSDRERRAEYDRRRRATADGVNTGQRGPDDSPPPRPDRSTRRTRTTQSSGGQSRSSHQSSTTRETSSDPNNERAATSRHDSAFGAIALVLVAMVAVIVVIGVLYAWELIIG